MLFFSCRGQLNWTRICWQTVSGVWRHWFIWEWQWVLHRGTHMKQWSTWSAPLLPTVWQPWTMKLPNREFRSLIVSMYVMATWALKHMPRSYMLQMLSYLSCFRCCKLNFWHLYGNWSFGMSKRQALSRCNKLNATLSLTHLPAQCPTRKKYSDFFIYCTHTMMNVVFF